METVSQGFRPGTRGAAMQGIASPAGRSPKALGSRRSGRAGESVGASASLDDPSSAAAALPLRRMDVPHRPRLPCYPPVGPTDRLPDLYESLSALFGLAFDLWLEAFNACPRGSSGGSTEASRRQHPVEPAEEPVRGRRAGADGHGWVLPCLFPGAGKLRLGASPALGPVGPIA